MHTVTMFPLGNADCCRIDLAGGQKILFDYANTRNADDPDDKRIDLEQELRSDMRVAKRDFYDVVAFTHLDTDHFCGATEFFELRHAAKYQGKERIKIQEHLWRRIAVAGREHDHSFTRASAAVRTTRVTGSADGVEVRSGVRGLDILKTTASGFVGYLKDAFTTLPETTDRIFATSLNAEWTYAPGKHDYDALWRDAHAAIEETFAEQHSLSVQHTLYAMGAEVLKRCPPVTRIRFAMPNKHHLLVDLGRFGMTNRNQIFVATREPYGLIEGEVVR